MSLPSLSFSSSSVRCIKLVKEHKVPNKCKRLCELEISGKSSAHSPSGEGEHGVMYEVGSDGGPSRDEDEVQPTRTINRETA